MFDGKPEYLCYKPTTEPPESDTPSQLTPPATMAAAVAGGWLWVDDSCACSRRRKVASSSLSPTFNISRRSRFEFEHLAASGKLAKAANLPNAYGKNPAGSTKDAKPVSVRAHRGRLVSAGRAGVTRGSGLRGVRAGNVWARQRCACALQESHSSLTQWGGRGGTPRQSPLL